MQKNRKRYKNPNVPAGEAIVTLVDDVFPYKKQDYEITVPLLLKPDKEKGEEIQSLVDNIPFRKRHRRRGDRNDESTSTISDVSPYEKQDYENTVAMLLKRDKEKEEEVQTLVDNIPFQRKPRRRLNRKHGSTYVDDVSPYEKQDYENTVAMLLKRDKEKGEEVQTLVDNIPFQTRHRRRGDRNGDSSLPIPYDEIPDEELQAEIEDTVPHMLEPEEDEKVLVLTDDIPFRS